MRLCGGKVYVAVSTEQSEQGLGICETLGKWIGMVGNTVGMELRRRWITLGVSRMG